MSHRINSSAPPVDDSSMEPRVEEEILGLTAKEFGKGFLSVNHMIGKTLLNAFGAGAIVQPLENVMQSGDVLENWAAVPSITVISADYAVLDVGADKPVVVRGVPKLQVFGGTRFAGNGYMPGDSIGRRFSFGVNDVPRVLVNDGKKETSYTKVKKLLVAGGIESAAPQAGVASMVNVKGEEMTDEELLNAAMAEVNAPSSAHQMVPPPPTAREVDLSRFFDFRRAKSRLGSAQAQLAAAKAKTPYVPVRPTSSPIEVPDLTESMRSMNMDLNLDDIVGEVNAVLGASDEDIQIVGDGWTEIVGDDYVLGSDVLVGAVPSASKVVRPSANAIAKAPVAQVKPANSGKQTQMVKPKGTPITPAIRAGSKKMLSKPLKRAARGARVSVFKKLDSRQPLMNKVLQIGVNAQKRAKIAQRATKVHGLDFEVLGAVVGKKPLTAKQKAAAAKRDKAVQKSQAIAIKLDKQGAKAIASAKKLAEVLKKVKPLRVKLKQNRAPMTRVRGDDGIPIHVSDDATFDVGESFDVELPPVGFVVGADPSDPNYDPRFDDPNYSGDYSAPAGTTPTAPADPYAADPGVPLSDGSLPGYVEQTWEDIPLPARGEALSEEEAMTVYDDDSQIPEDAIYYRLERGLPADSLGSVSVMFDKTGLKDGFKFGFGRYRNQDKDLSGTPDWVQRDALSVAKHEWNRDYPNGLSDSTRKMQKTSNLMKFWTVFDEPNQIASSIPEAAAQSQARVTRVANEKTGELEGEYNWGPFVGHPNGALKGLQFNKAAGAFFWMPEKAPRWSADVVAIDNMIKEANKVGREAVAEANKTNKLIAQQEQAERERAVAQQEAELSLATNQAEVDAAIASSKLEQQQAAMDAQAAAMQTALDMQAQKMDLQYGAREDALYQRAMQADLDWAIAHPEEAMADQQQGYGYEGDAGYGLDEGYGVDDEFAQAYEQSQIDSGADEASMMDAE